MEWWYQHHITRDDLARRMSEDKFPIHLRYRNFIENAFDPRIKLNAFSLTDEELDILFHYALVMWKNKSALGITKKLCKNCMSEFGINYCAVCECEEYIEVDTLMVPIIQQLNRSGWYTAYCCAGALNPGHTYHAQAYIKFQSRITKFVPMRVFTSLPNSWKMEYKEGAITLICTNRCDHSYLKNLETWVKKLPNI